MQVIILQMLKLQIQLPSHNLDISCKKTFISQCDWFNNIYRFVILKVIKTVMQWDVPALR